MRINELTIYTGPTKTLNADAGSPMNHYRNIETVDFRLVYKLMDATIRKYGISVHERENDAESKIRL